MTISATIIADSISPAGKRLRTWLLRYPRFIHAELLTHRVLSRNSSSSRAIPVERLIADIERDPAMPSYWGKNQPGMQAREELSPEQIEVARASWGAAAWDAVTWARELARDGAHKQIVNRVLEPFAHINVVVSATEMENFYELRRHPDAQPEIQLLAEAMWQAEQASKPTLLYPGQWHLPYIDVADTAEAVAFAKRGRITRDEPGEREINTLLRKVSAARCGRTSYLTFEGKRSTVEEDLKLCAKLIGGKPFHASPFEHQATPDDTFTVMASSRHYRNPREHRNFVGWRQSRALFEQEFARAA